MHTKQQAKCNNKSKAQKKKQKDILGFTEEVSILRILYSPPPSPLNHSIANEVDCCIAIIVTILTYLTHNTNLERSGRRLGGCSLIVALVT